MTGDLNALSLPDLYTELSRTGLVRRLIDLARDEDLGPRGGRGDSTGRVCIGETDGGVASIVARQGGIIVAGLRALPEAVEVFSPGVRLNLRAEDGRAAEAGGVLAELSGPLRDLLAIERTALNLVGRLSGVATKAAEYVQIAAGGGRARVYDTRKTTPGLRVLEKYAVRCGGGMCHRIGLHDAVLIKDNHLRGGGGAGLALPLLAAFVQAAADRARALPRGPGERELSFVEVEVESLEQLRVILDAGGCGVDIVLLDNLSVDQLRQAVLLRDRSGAAIELEASGGVTMATIGAISGTGVDRISVGAMTHHAVWVDVAMDVSRV